MDPQIPSLQARKHYWDTKYLAYWKARVEEAGSGDSAVIAGDKKTEDDSVYERIFADNPFRPGSLLDVGCAWGRLFPLYLDAGLQVAGVDISAAMVAEARRCWSDQAAVLSIDEAVAEQLPFEACSFDNVVCIATFDATEQHLALAECLRVLKPGGLLMLTGKNSRYCVDDRPALEAERGARSKGHPNFFTDTPRLIADLQQCGHELRQGYYFARRGDFADFAYSDVLPAEFYEYCLIIHKGAMAVSVDQTGFAPFASPYSQTYLSLHAADA